MSNVMDLGQAIQCIDECIKHVRAAEAGYNAVDNEGKPRLLIGSELQIADAKYVFAKSKLDAAFLFLGKIYYYGTI